MSSLPDPISLVAERAVRYLARCSHAVSSTELLKELLSTEMADEAAATRLLKSTLGADPRLRYSGRAWSSAVEPRDDGAAATVADADRALIHLEGCRPARGEPYELRSVSALRLRGNEVLAACGGDTVGGAYGNRLRRAVLEVLEGAVPIVHDPPGSLRALERWLGESLAGPLSLRRVAQERVGLAAGHDLETLVARLGLEWRETEDPLEQADLLDACLAALRRPGESLSDLRERGRGARPLDWTRFAFNREFLRNVPHVPGTYRFYDRDGALIYVGKSKDLHTRLASYFREEGRPRPDRVQRILEALHRIEYEAAGSDLEAMLREAELIRREDPERNVQRKLHKRRSRSSRLRSILILEPAEPPAVLRAYLIREERLLDRVDIGPRGGGLKRIRRLLDDHFFSVPDGPTPATGPDLDVEIVVRWLAANRDAVVAFDPTDLPDSGEVVDRLRWFLGQGSPFDTDGSPIHSR